MSKKLHLTVLEEICDLLKALLDYGIGAYLCLLIAVLPFYFEQGYGYIASDKARFYYTVSINFGKVFLPLAVVYIILLIAENHAKILNFWRENRGKERIKKIFCKISAIDFFVGMYAVALLISYLCSDYQENTLWGEKGWYMGLYPQLILLGAYFFVAKLWVPRRGILYLMLPASAVVFGLGYVNRFGWYPIQMEYASTLYISTIGNINWYCGYMMPVLFVGICLFWQGSSLLNSDTSQKWKKTVNMLVHFMTGAYICLSFGSLITQGSASGILAFGVMMVILFYLSAGHVEQMLQFWKVAIFFFGACLITMILRILYPNAFNYDDGVANLFTTGIMPIVVTIVSVCGMLLTVWFRKKGSYSPKIVIKSIKVCVTLVSCGAILAILLVILNTLYPGILGRWSGISFFTFSDTWGSLRGATWKAGALCFWEQDFLHKLVGVGPDGMWSYMSADGSDTLAQIMVDNFEITPRLTNAHNEWLTVLVNTGLLGLVSFVGIIVSAVIIFMRGVRSRIAEGGLPDREKGDKSADAVQMPVACALGILAYTVNNMFSFQQVMNFSMLIMLLGMGQAFLRQTGHQAE